MNIGIIDADLIGRRKHRFPNLACMKLSAYYDKRGDKTELCWSYEGLEKYQRVFVSKVFTDTPLPIQLMREFDRYRVTPESERSRRKFQFGGTGFYFDKAPNLPDEIEHVMPNYSLYDSWIENEVDKARRQAEVKGRDFNEKAFRAQFKEYTDYSIGFLTRGCFRKCPFCVNQKYSHVFRHSPLSEFLNESRRKICLLDDNFFGFNQDFDREGSNHSKPGESPPWKALLQELKETGRPFKFKQGLDERLLTREICEELFASNYDGDYTFAFDKIQDYDLIHQKLEIIRSIPMARKAAVRFYVLVGFVENGDGTFAVPDATDIRNAFVRIALLQKYRCLPYIMRFQSKNDKPWKQSRYEKIYTEMARWCNQPSFFKKKSFREYCQACESYHHSHGGRSAISSTWRAYCDFIKENPEIEAQFFNLKFGQVSNLVGEPDFARLQREKRENVIIGRRCR